MFKKLLLIILPLRSFLPVMFSSRQTRVLVELVLSAVGIIGLFSLVVCDLVSSMSVLLLHINVLVTDISCSLVMASALTYLTVSQMGHKDQEASDPMKSKQDLPANQGEIHGCQLLLGTSGNRDECSLMMMLKLLALSCLPAPVLT